MWLSALFLVQCRLRSPLGKAAESLTALADTLLSLQRRVGARAAGEEDPTTDAATPHLELMARIRNDRACALHLLAFVDAFEKLLHAAHSGTAYALPSLHLVYSYYQYLCSICTVRVLYFLN